jgi:hypothetical protein
LAACALVNFVHAVGIARKAHFLARQFGHPSQAGTRLHQKVFHRHRLQVGVPDAGGSDAVTTRDPSGLKAAENTESSWPRRTAISFVVAASQMRAVLSHDAVTMRDPSGLNAADRTGPS